jgi:hypothetical protein
VRSTVGWLRRVVRWAKLAGAVLAAIVLFSTVPLWPWWPTCGGRLITGDYPDVYVDEFTDSLAQGDIYFWRFGDVVLLRVLPAFDGTDLIPRRSVVASSERKLAEALSDDQTINGVLSPAPEAVKRLKKELEPIIGPDRRFAPDGTRLYYGSDTRVGRNCRLFRAAILEPEP